MSLPRIGITLGDPGGIGPETVLKALSPGNSLPKVSYLLFGSSSVIEEEKRTLGLNIEIQPDEKTKESQIPSISLLEIETSLKTVKKGSPSKENGEASFLFFKKAVEEAEKGTVQALVTAPISKHSWNLAGLKWSGHTDYLSQAYSQAIMTFWSEKLKVALFTHHLPLKSALEEIKRKNLQDFFLNLHKSIEAIKPGIFHYMVAGLNPHCGEGGLFGHEDDTEIRPAVKLARQEGKLVEGPVPADTVFSKMKGGMYDAVVVMYHDQGHIPTKLVGFQYDDKTGQWGGLSGVNVTLGLPIVRTSVDHGTAFGKAGEGRANPQSMIDAIHLGALLSRKLKK